MQAQSFAIGAPNRWCFVWFALGESALFAFVPSSGPDIMARLLRQKLSEA